MSEHKHEHSHEHASEHAHPHQHAPAFPSPQAGIVTAFATAASTGKLPGQRVVLLTQAGLIEGDIVDENTKAMSSRMTLFRNIAQFGNELYHGCPDCASHTYLHLSNVIVKGPIETRVDNLVVFFDQIIAVTLAKIG